MTFLCPFFKDFFDKQFSKDSIQKILVFQTGGIGDVLRIFPLIEALREEFPTSEISTLTEFNPDIFRLMKRKEIINHILRFDFGISFYQKMQFLFRLRRSGYDLVINPERGSGMAECTIICFIIGKKWRLGFICNGIGFLHTNKLGFRDDLPIVVQNKDLLKAIGIEPNGRENFKVHLEILNGYLREAEEILGDAIAENRIIIGISPTVANHPELFEWPLHRFIELSQVLIEKKKAVIVLLGLSRDIKMSEFFSKQLSTKAHFKNLVGKTDLLGAAAIIKTCDLFIGNDSGLLHIAQALEVPSIGIFGPTSPEQVLSPSDNVRIVQRKISCSPCYLHQPYFDFRCAYDTRCLKGITVNDVINKVEELLER